MRGCNINFPHPKRLCPDTAMLPLAYLRYNRECLPIGKRKYRGSLLVHPYNSSFTDKQWGLSALLSFTAMLPNAMSAILVQSHTQGGRERRRWKLFDKGEEVD